MVELAQEDDASEVVSVMGGEAFQLLANRHGSGRLARRGWAAYGLVESVCISGRGSGLLVAVEETLG